MMEQTISVRPPAGALDLAAERREFWRLIGTTVLPLLIQSFFMQSVLMVNQLMVGSLGTAVVAAVGAANKLLTIYNSFLYGSCSGCAMFLAQFWGKRDIQSFRRMLGVTISVTLSVGAVITAAIMLAPTQLVTLFAADPVVIREGSRYLRAVAPAYFIMALTFPLNYAMRSMNIVRVTMVSTIVSMLVNCAVNYALIFGVWGMPKMGVLGAAIGTIATRAAELIFLLSYLWISKSPLTKEMKSFFRFRRGDAGQFLKKAVPLIGNEMMWSLGTTIYFMVYGKAGTDALATMSIMQTLQMFAKLFIGGFSGASAIIIGNEIGKGDAGRVQRFCHRFHIASLIVGVASSLMVFALIRPVLSAYAITGTNVGDYVGKCMIILSIYIALNSVNSMNIEGIFRSGGDVRFIAFADMGSIWMVGMPFTLITGIALRMDIVIVYCAYIALELYKLPLVLHRFRTGKWISQLGAG